MRNGVSAKRTGMAGVLSSLIVAAGLVVLTAAPAAATAFSNTAAMTIPGTGSSGPASLYPSAITVSGLSGTIVDVNVSLTGLNHTFPDDIDVLVVGPAGQKVVLMSGAGGDFDLTGVGLTFDDAGASSLPDNAQIVSGTVKPTVTGGDSFNGPAPAPAAPYATTLAGFNATAPNGTWNLFVYDDTLGDVGSMSGGWSLDIVTNAPTITSFTPAGGNVGSAVVITGTNFTGATAVKFGGIAAASFTVDSATQITATVPAGANTGPITVTTPIGTATSATSFQIALSIASFAPTSGPVGTSVVITGTTFTGATAVKFNGTPAAAFTVDSATQITVTVPAGAGTGPITVTTPLGTAASATSFVVKHARSVSLTLSGQKAKGSVSVTDGFAACGRGVPVKEQHLVHGTWKTVGSTLTKADGAYKLGGLTDSGKYRTVAKKTTLSSGDVCLKDISPTAKK